MKKLISVLASALLLSAVMSNSLSAFAAESNVPETAESTTVTSAEESELITDYETIRSMLQTFGEEQNYDELLGMTITQMILLTFPEQYDNIIVSFDYVPSDDPNLDIEAVAKFKEYMKQNNIDSSLVDFDLRSKDTYVGGGMIDDLEMIASMIREFLDSQGYSKVCVCEPDGKEHDRYPIVRVIFPQKSIEEPDYTDEDFQPLNDFIKESNINPLLVCIMWEDDAAEPIEPEPVSGDIDGDGKATLYDAIIVCKCMIDAKDVTEEQKAKADINSDGNVDLYDAIYVAECMIQ